MKRKLLIISACACFFMLGYHVSSVVNANLEIQHFKLLFYSMFGVYFLYHYTNEIKQS